MSTVIKPFGDLITTPQVQKGASGQKVYRALLSQTGGEAAVVKVLENTFERGITITAGVNAGAFVVNSDKEFNVDKTTVSFDDKKAGPTTEVNVANISDSVIGFGTYVGTTPTANLLAGTLIEIITYQ